VYRVNAGGGCSGAKSDFEEHEAGVRGFGGLGGGLGCESCNIAS
jgi:hypothetical protein